MTALDLAALVPDAELLQMWDYESDFGLAEIAMVIEERFKGRVALNCLEIGSGSGLLLYKLRSRYPSFTFEGIEPAADVFSKTEAPLQRISAALDLKIHRGTYETFMPSHGYDLIFSVNVFEHVADWRDYLTRTHALLIPGGVSVILCPNQAFPLESHFVIPIIVNKRITYALLGDYIRRFEKTRACEGLWRDLNFVARPAVTRFLKAHGLSFRYDERVMDRMFRRMFTDPHFQQRLKIFAGLSRFAHRIGLTRATELPGIRAYAPFMKLIVSKPAV